MIGQRFGQLTVFDQDSDGMLRATCDCGSSFGRFTVLELQSGRTLYCKGKAHKQTYALLAKSLSVVKIGCADRIEPRIADLQRCSPAPLTLIGISTDNIEHQMHAALGDRWSHGEWFSYDVEVDDLISRHMTRLEADLIGFVRGKTGSVPCLSCGNPLHQMRDCSGPANDEQQPEQPQRRRRAFSWRGTEREWSKPR